MAFVEVHQHDIDVPRPDWHIDMKAIETTPASVVLYSVYCGVHEIAVPSYFEDLEWHERLQRMGKEVGTHGGYWPFHTQQFSRPLYEFVRRNTSKVLGLGGDYERHEVADGNNADKNSQDFSTTELDLDVTDHGAAVAAADATCQSRPAQFVVLLFDTVYADAAVAPAVVTAIGMKHFRKQRLSPPELHATCFASTADDDLRIITVGMRLEDLLLRCESGRSCDHSCHYGEQEEEKIKVSEAEMEDRMVRAVLRDLGLMTSGADHDAFATGHSSASGPALLVKIPNGEPRNLLQCPAFFEGFGHVFSNAEGNSTNAEENSTSIPCCLSLGAKKTTPSTSTNIEEYLPRTRDALFERWLSLLCASPLVASEMRHFCGYWRATFPGDVNAGGGVRFHFEIMVEEGRYLVLHKREEYFSCAEERAELGLRCSRPRRKRRARGGVTEPADVVPRFGLVCGSTDRGDYLQTGGWPRKDKYLIGTVEELSKLHITSPGTQTRRWIQRRIDSALEYCLEDKWSEVQSGGSVRWQKIYQPFGDTLREEIEREALREWVFRMQKSETETDLADLIDPPSRPISSFARVSCRCVSTISPSDGTQEGRRKMPVVLLENVRTFGDILRFFESQYGEEVGLRFPSHSLRPHIANWFFLKIKEEGCVDGEHNFYCETDQSLSHPYPDCKPLHAEPEPEAAVRDRALLFGSTSALGIITRIFADVPVTAIFQELPRSPPATCDQKQCEKGAARLYNFEGLVCRLVKEQRRFGRVWQ
ncbi:unnamed protein product [Amoebophrya sp. A120]|nr:unnamed protein product [Amoebophrya sp. A120]|eukprot:GSA120T00015244001.1